jgi:hypothetical protein
MASYEYSDIDEYKSYIVGKAKTKLLYKSNMIDSDNLTAILNDLFTDSYNIIKKWRHLKKDDEFLSQKWDTEIVNFVVESYRVMGDENLATISANGISKGYKISPEAKLKSSIPQAM